MEQLKKTLIELKNDSYEAFNALYSQYFDLLYGFIFKLTRSHDLTSELVQDTFIKVWTNRKKIDPEQSFKAWLYTIAKNHLLDQMKKQWNQPLFEDYLNHCTDENLTVNTNEDSFDFEVFRKLLEKAKQKLSPRQKEIFERNKEQDYSVAEIASQLKITEQAVYNYLSQAKTILQKEMKPFRAMFLWLFWAKTGLR